MQRRHRDDALIDGGEVGVRQGRLLVAQRSDPVIGSAARVVPLDQVVAELAAALGGHFDALDRAGRHIREVDVEVDVAGPFDRDQLSDQLGRVPFGRGPFGRTGVVGELAQGDRGQSHQGAFHGRGDGARIGHVLAQIAAPVHTGQDQVGRVILEDVADRQQHAVRGRAVHGEMAVGQAADAQGMAQGQGMAGAALLRLGRHHPDIVRKGPRDLLEGLEPGRVHAVVVGEQDPRSGQLTQRRRHVRRPARKAGPSRPYRDAGPRG